MKTFTISFEYTNKVTGEMGIVPTSIKANNAKEAVEKLISEQKAQGCEVKSINGVWHQVVEPRGGWRALLEASK